MKIFLIVAIESSFVIAGIGIGWRESLFDLAGLTSLAFMVFGAVALTALCDHERRTAVIRTQKWCLHELREIREEAKSRVSESRGGYDEHDI